MPLKCIENHTVISVHFLMSYKCCAQCSSWHYRLQLLVLGRTQAGHWVVIYLISKAWMNTCGAGATKWIMNPFLDQLDVSNYMFTSFSWLYEIYFFVCFITFYSCFARLHYMSHTRLSRVKQASDNVISSKKTERSFKRRHELRVK